MQLNELSAMKRNDDSRIHFENADVTITKIERKGGNNSRLKSGIKSDQIQPISIASVSNGNTKPINTNGIRSQMKRQLSNGPMVKKRISTPNNARKSIPTNEKNNAHQAHENIIN